MHSCINKGDQAPCTYQLQSLHARIFTVYNLHITIILKVQTPPRDYIFIMREPERDDQNVRLPRMISERT